jgi:hypothetical protein
MAKILGLGGVLLSFKGDKEALHLWYHEHLGLIITYDKLMQVLL